MPEDFTETINHVAAEISNDTARIAMLGQPQNFRRISDPEEKFFYSQRVFEAIGEYRKFNALREEIAVDARLSDTGKNDKLKKIQEEYFEKIDSISRNVEGHFKTLEAAAESRMKIAAKDPADFNNHDLAEFNLRREIRQRFDQLKPSDQSAYFRYLCENPSDKTDIIFDALLEYPDFANPLHEDLRSEGHQQRKKRNYKGRKGI